MVAYVLMAVMCLVSGAAAYLYAQYKISLGPEDGEMPEGESADAVMKNYYEFKLNEREEL